MNNNNKKIVKKITKSPGQIIKKKVTGELGQKKPIVKGTQIKISPPKLVGKIKPIVNKVRLNTDDNNSHTLEAKTSGIKSSRPIKTAGNRITKSPNNVVITNNNIKSK